MGNKCSKKKAQQQLAVDEKKQIELKQQQQKAVNEPTKQLPQNQESQVTKVKETVVSDINIENIPKQVIPIKVEIIEKPTEKVPISPNEDDLALELGIKISTKKRSATLENEPHHAHHFSMIERVDANNSNQTDNVEKKVVPAHRAHNRRRAYSDVDPRHRKVHKPEEPLTVHLEPFETRLLKALAAVEEYEKAAPAVVAPVEIIDDDH